ncbi:hypothetical protein M2368_000605 [Arthrobacter sp. JUb119]|nr:hypothetical protein [Arthrobacter sp. JUb119]
MHSQIEIVGKAAEELLALGKGLFQLMAVDARGIGAETALRRSNQDRLPAKDIVELAGKSVKGMTFRHD